MSSYNDLYLNGQFFFSYGAYVFAKNEDGTMNSKDIGLSKGNAVAGISGARQFAALMNEGCIDDTIKLNRYEKIVNGSYFCTVSTPDTYSLFLEKIILNYEGTGLSKDEATKRAEENLMMIELPTFMPKDGDLSKDSSQMTESDCVYDINLTYQLWWRCCATGTGRLDWFRKLSKDSSS